ncbi:MAG TPA: type II toxin-antitoxin system ParD family antitoxin [Stellaceae bacterium]
MPTRNVVLTQHHEDVIKVLVESGRYQNASEVLRDGLRLVEAREQRMAAQLKALQDAASIGIADLDQGRYTEFDSADDLADYLNHLSEQVLAGARDDR